MSQSKSNNSTTGFILVFIGLYFLLRNMQVIPSNISNILFSWEFILIGIGTILAITKENNSSGFILIAIGTAFIIKRELNLDWVRAEYVWPSILIFAGLIFITQKKKFHGKQGINLGKKKTKSINRIEDLNIFSGAERMIQSDSFEGGSITTIFGGGEYDLSHAELAPGTSHLELFVLFGGVSVAVPSHWKVSVSVTPIFGGAADERTASIIAQTEDGRELIIKGVCIFGGAEIKTSNSTFE